MVINIYIRSHGRMSKRRADVIIWSHFDICLKTLLIPARLWRPGGHSSLLRASCGQPSHTRLYQPADNGMLSV
ncbi:hypothetical protein KCP71_07440 [Salmonella enterica subsp. enterica]|nr:hypothetical protein KCP71_07440 [Salmonella enterica subsp. enterica]